MKIRKLISAILCAALMLSLSVTAFADSEPTEIEGDVTGVNAISDFMSGSSSVSYTDSNSKSHTLENTSEATFKGSVSNATEDGNAVTANGFSVSITVEGDVNSQSGYAVYAVEGATVTVDGDIASINTSVKADVGATVAVEGDISSSNGAGTAIEAYCSSSVNVDGDCNGNVYATDHAKVDVDGDINSKNNGITAGSNTVVTVTGDVSTESSSDNQGAIYINGDNNTVVIEGTATGGKNAIVLNGDNSSFNGNVIIVKELDGDVGYAGDESQLGEGGLSDLVKKIVNYIVGAKKEDMKGAQLTGTSTKTVGEKSYLVAQEGDELTVSGSNIKNVSAGNNAEVIKNDDGTFTIRVLYGGALNIEVTLDASGDEGNSTYTAPAIFISFEKNYIAEAGKDLKIVGKITSGESFIRNHLADSTVFVDGERAEGDSYAISIQDGELIVEFEADFLAALEAGSHAVKMNIGGYVFGFKIAV